MMTAASPNVRPWIYGPLIVAAGALVGWQLLRSSCSPPPEAAAPDRRRLLRQWRRAVQQGDPAGATAAAAKLSHTAPRPATPPAYAALCRKYDIKTSYLQASFNGWDAQLWADAFFFHRLARQITAAAPADQSAVEAVFAAVCRRLAAARCEATRLLWPRTIWEHKRGLCDRQAWVLCELAYQLGYETQIVYLWDAVADEQPHTIAEIRRGDQVWLADPFTRQLRPGVSAWQLAHDPELAAALWPDRDNWQRAARNPVFWLPAYPQDYCRRNQTLQAEARRVLGEDCPRFGDDPATRLARYRQLQPAPARELPHRLWFYPFALLRAQMIDARRADTP